jgi:hypothetical protein
MFLAASGSSAQARWLQDQGLDVCSGQTQTVQAGIDMKRGGKQVLARGGKCGPGGDLAERGNDGNDAGFSNGFGGTFENSIEHVDSGIGGKCSRLHRFGECGNEEGLAAGRGQRRYDTIGAETISIGFDDRAAFSRTHQLGQGPPVRRNAVEVDDEHAGRMRWDLVKDVLHDDLARAFPMFARGGPDAAHCSGIW